MLMRYGAHGDHSDDWVLGGGYSYGYSEKSVVFRGTKTSPHEKSNFVEGLLDMWRKFDIQADT